MAGGRHSDEDKNEKKKVKLMHNRCALYSGIGFYIQSTNHTNVKHIDHCFFGQLSRIH